MHEKNKPKWQNFFDLRRKQKAKEKNNIKV